MKLFAAIAVLATSYGRASAQEKEADVLDFVDPLIGTANGGHVFPGASMPFGMAKAGPDTNEENQGGFDSAAEFVTGFSHMHDSGTGGAESLGNFPVFPLANCPEDDVKRCRFTRDERATKWINGTAKGRPGSFSIKLENSIQAAMTSTNHTALYKFAFPDKEPLKPLVLLDLVDLPGTRNKSSASVDSKSGRITGSGTFEPSFGEGQYDLHVCADFKGAKIRETGTFKGDDVQPGSESINLGAGDGKNSSAGAFVRFDTPAEKQILVRVGVSFMSVKQACGHAEKELSDFDFKSTVSQAEDAWRKKLSVVEIDAGGVDRDMEVTFWSGIYRAMLSPQDYTGENPQWKSDEPYYDSFYCIWDSFRIVHPLLTILDPHSHILMVRTLLEVYRQEGYLPDCRMSLCKGWTQGGSNADALLADSYVKGLEGGIDWETAYEAMIKDAEVEPPDWAVEGRGQVKEYQELGYVPTNSSYKQSVSRTVEYAYNDFCIAQMAKDMGHDDDYEKYSKRSLNGRNMYRKEQKSSLNGTDTGFVGFLQPRFANGSWGQQDPAECSPILNFDGCYLNPEALETYEGSPWLYTFYAPHDMSSLIKTLGGPDKFSSRLDFFHSSGIAYLGNEPNFLTVYQYHYAGKPQRSIQQIHAYIPKLFHAGIGGIPGNDDSGAMGAFAAFSMLGLYPVAGQDVYLLVPPFFRKVSVRNPLTGKKAEVRNKGFDAGYEKVFVKRVTRDGKPWTRNWIGHDFFTEGGVLEFELGTEDEAGDWGTKAEDLPPSMDH